MRFLADESCDFAVVCALRDAGYDVASAKEISPRAEDSIVLELANREERILLTEDKDFGQLVFASRQEAGGVIFIRFPVSARSELASSMVELIKQHGNKIRGRFVVLQPRCIRID